MYKPEDELAGNIQHIKCAMYADLFILGRENRTDSLDNIPSFPRFLTTMKESALYTLWAHWINHIFHNHRQSQTSPLLDYLQLILTAVYFHKNYRPGPGCSKRR